MALKKILIVDDEAGIRKMFRRHLERAGYEVFEGESCVRSIQILKQHEIDLILMDIIMPKIDGIHCLGRVKKHFQNIPVIMVTGVDNVQTGVEVMKKGAFDYIVKPVNKIDLLNAVKNGIKAKELKEREERLEPFKVHYIMLLDNTSIVMYHKNLDPNIEMDGDLFGSMFSVIKTFIKDTLQVGGGLKNIEHGDYKILVEDGPNFFIAVIGTGEDIIRFREKMKNVVNKINNDYRVIIADWNGDMSKFKDMEQEFKELIMENG